MKNLENQLRTKTSLPPINAPIVSVYLSHVNVFVVFSFLHITYRVHLLQLKPVLVLVYGFKLVSKTSYGSIKPVWKLNQVWEHFYKQVVC